MDDRRRDLVRWNQPAVEFVDDIPYVDGAWKLVGHLKIGTEGCLVCDPRGDLDFYFVPIEMESGTYRVEVSEDSTKDILGVRTLRTKKPWVEVSTYSSGSSGWPRSST